MALNILAPLRNQSLFWLPRERFTVWKLLLGPGLGQVAPFTFLLEKGEVLMLLKDLLNIWLRWLHRGLRLQSWRVIFTLMRWMTAEGLEVGIRRILCINSRKMTILLISLRWTTICFATFLIIAQLLAHLRIVFWCLISKLTLWNRLLTLSVRATDTNKLNLVNERLCWVEAVLLEGHICLGDRLVCHWRFLKRV